MKKFERICGIYKYTNKINGKCYIGQSIDIHNRYMQHIRDSKTKSSNAYNSSFEKALRKYGIENFTFEILEQCRKEELNEKEIYYISLFNSYLCGYNSSLGGNNYEHLYKPVYQIDYGTKQIIKRFENVYIAQEETNTNAKSIYDICNKHRKTANGYIWCYVNDYKEGMFDNYKRLNRNKPILQINRFTNEVVNRYSSSRQASKELGIDYRAISDVCRGRKGHHTYKGFIWKFA